MERSKKNQNMLQKDLARKTAEIEILTRLTRAINKPAFKLSEFYRIIEEFLTEYFKAASYYICTVNKEENTITMEVFIDDGERFHNYTIPVSEGFISYIVKTGKKLLINDVVGNYDKLPVKPVVAGKNKLAYSWLGVPIKRKTDVIGVLNIANYNATDFTEEDAELLEAIADQISLALEFYNSMEKIKESETKYRNLVENLNDIICIMDTQQRIVSVNKAVRNTLGYEPEEVIGKTLFELLPEEYEDRLYIYLARIQKKKSARGKLRLYSKYGEKKLFEFNSSFIKVEENIEGIRAVLRDITLKEDQLNEIKILKKFNEDIVNYSPIGIFTINRAKIITFENSTLKKIIKIKDGIVGWSLKELESIISADFDKMVDVAFKGISSERFNYLYKATGSDEEVYITLRISPIFDPTGSVDKVLCIIEDTTESVKLEKQLIRAERLASVGVFASGIAHEINNPAFAAFGLAETILEEKNIPKIREYAEKIKECILDISDIVQKLSRYTRYEASSGITTIRINEALDDAVLMAKKSKKADLQIVTDYNGDVEFEANGPEIQQIFFNLISNSIDAISDSGKIEIKTKVYKDYIKITISDNGSGIMPENLDKIFDPLFTTKDPGVGIGLGLNVVYRLVTKYKGSIDVDSKPGKGTVFTVQLPLGN